MKKFKRFIMIGAMVMLVGATTVTAFAASSYGTPAEAVAGLTGKTVEDVIAERSESGKTYGTIANDAGKLEEFRAEMLQIKKDALAEKVAAGLMTQERADEIAAAIENNQTNCDGTGAARIGQGMGAGFGGMQGNGQGNRGFGQFGGNCQVQQ
ncbi:MAG TPA: hypothetical protein VEA58_09900 [Anaerovoracaceae bacterium]|nr:hypothetical protein [Anaerovoracaceae bacterium]